MEDRLIEFQKMAGVSSNTSIQSSQDSGSSRDFLPQFSSRTKLLQQALNQVRYNNQEILRLKDKHREATLNENEKKFSDEINKLIDQNNVLSMTIKDQLSKMKDDIEESKKSNPDEPETRMKVISHQSLSNKFSEVLKESQSVQLNYKGGVKEKLARQAKIYDNTLSPEELEEIVNDPEGMQKLVSSRMIGGAHTKIQNAVSDIQDKYRDIIKLEKSVEIMHQMFVDMAILVHAGGESITSIEVNVNDTRNYVKKAIIELDKGKKDSQKAKKWRCCLFIGGLILVVILLWPVLHII